MFHRKNAAIKCILLMTFSISLLLCNCSEKEPLTKSKAADKKEWSRLLEANPLPESAVRLEVDFTFPKEEAGNQIMLHSPNYFCSDSVGNIYISDTGNHVIQKFNSKGKYLLSIGKPGQEPGKLRNPTCIGTDGSSNLFVFDTGNQRLQIFGLKGQYKSSFRFYKTYSRMAVDHQGNIYVSSLTASKEEPLIEVLNTKGRIIRTFGKRIKFKDCTRAHNSVAIAINSNGEVYVAWLYFPVIRVYSTNGNQENEIDLRYKLLTDLAAPNYKAKRVKNKIAMRSVITAIRAKEDRIFVFIRYPRIEILELQRQGKITGHYWSDYPYIHYFSDFLMLKNSEDQPGKFYILSVFPERCAISHWSHKLSI